MADFERQVVARDTRLTGSLRITCPDGFEKPLTELMAAFHEHHPGLFVEVLIDDRMFDLAKGEADVAIRAGNLEDSSLVAFKIADGPWAVYAARAYVERHGRPYAVADLRQHRVIGFTGAIANSNMGRWLSANIPDANIVARANNPTGLTATAKTGVGLALLPTHFGEVEPELVRVIDTISDLQSKIWLLTHPDLRETPRVRAFFDFVKSQKSLFLPGGGRL